MMTDKQRVEVALPARLIFGVAVCDCFGADPDAPDQEEAKRAVTTQTAELKRLLSIANVEPFGDLVGKDRRKVARRIDRLAETVAADFDQEPAVSIALTLYYFLSDLLDREILTLHPGSAFDQAMTGIFLPAIEGGLKAAASTQDDVNRIDRAAQRRARKLLDRVQALGYYRDRPSAVAA